MTIEIPRRFSNISPPETWGRLLPEMWSTIFSVWPPFEYRGLLTTSRWFRDLYWDYKRTLSIGYTLNKTFTDDRLIKVVFLCNPDYMESITLTNICITNKSI